jgi:serine/threonine protein phosphatase PrpC
MDPFILLEADLPEPACADLEGADAWLHSTPLPGKGTPNEDALGLWDLPGVGRVLAVADGLGGAAGGARAAACAIEALGRSLAARQTGDDLRGPILDAFEAANREILELGIGAGTTLVVVEICGRRLRSYHVGDSAAFVVGQRGRLKLETLPHSPVGYGVAAGLIHPEAALDRADRHFVANHLGSGDMHIQVGSPIDLSIRDTLLVSSDGLLDNLLPSEILETIRTGRVENNARALARLAGERMQGEDTTQPSKPDDLSFILYRERETR